jgi:hypothetical protein
VGHAGPNVRATHRAAAAGAAAIAKVVDRQSSACWKGFAVTGADSAREEPFGREIHEDRAGW